MRATIAAASCAIALLAGLAPAGALDLTKGRTRLPELVLGSDGDNYAVSPKSIAMQGGKSYRLSITSRGQMEYKFFAPEFFRNIWINQIVIDHLEVHMAGAPDHLEFDDQGTISIDFVPIRSGDYAWSIEGLESKGMTGRFVIE